MYIHTLMVLQQMSQHSQHQSLARIRVPSGPFGLVEQGLLFEHFFLLQNFQTGWEHGAILHSHMVVFNAYTQFVLSRLTGTTRPEP